MNVGLSVLLEGNTAAEVISSRTQNEISEARQSFKDKLRYDAYRALKPQISNGVLRVVNVGTGATVARLVFPAEFYEELVRDVARIENQYTSRELEIDNDEMRAFLLGRLSTLRWLQGHDWE